MKLTKLQFGLIGIIALLLAIAILLFSGFEGNKYNVIEKANQSESKYAKDNNTVIRSSEFQKMLIPITEISRNDVLLDVSENAPKHIKGAVVIPYTTFILGGGLLKSLPEVSKILGDAGVSSNERLVIYGECMPCGGGPAPVTYIYWMMKCLGHENVKVLDGNTEDWAAAGLLIANKSTVRPVANYSAKFTPVFLASYAEVKSGDAQIVDARPLHEFNISTIPGAVNIPYDNVLENRTIKSESALKEVFAGLNRSKLVVVFTTTGIKASVVWFSLKLVGYNAKLYTWQDWLANQPPKGNTSTNATG